MNGDSAFGGNDADLDYQDSNLLNPESFSDPELKRISKEIIQYSERLGDLGLAEVTPRAADCGIVLRAIDASLKESDVSLLENQIHVSIGLGDVGKEHAKTALHRIWSIPDVVAREKALKDLFLLDIMPTETLWLRDTTNPRYHTLKTRFLKTKMIVLEKLNPEYANDEELERLFFIGMRYVAAAALCGNSWKMAQIIREVDKQAKFGVDCDLDDMMINSAVKYIRENNFIS